MVHGRYSLRTSKNAVWVLCLAKVKCKVFRWRVMFTTVNGWLLCIILFKKVKRFTFGTGSMRFLMYR